MSGNKPQRKPTPPHVPAVAEVHPFLTARHVDNLSERTAAHTIATTRSELATARLEIATNKLADVCERVEASNNRLADVIAKLLEYFAPPTPPQQPSGPPAPKEH